MSNDTSIISLRMYQSKRIGEFVRKFTLELELVYEIEFPSLLFLNEIAVSGILPPSKKKSM